jgi:hypothetical protein
MTFQTEYQLEIEGIIETINEYAIENFVRSYTKQLKHLSYPQDKETISIIIDRLVDWYQRSMETIDNSRFVPNKHEHHQSYSLLIEFQSKLKS